MSDLISREKLKDDIAVLLERNDKLIDEWLANCIDDVIDEQPTVDAVKHGHWVDDNTNYYYANCSICGYEIDIHVNRGYHNYCPNCGARMDEEVEE